MTRVGHALLTLVGGACLAVGCSSSPRDTNFGTDAESNFQPPLPSPDAGADSATDEAGAIGGTGGDIGAAGAGGSAGTGTPSNDGDSDVASDAGTP